MTLFQLCKFSCPQTLGLDVLQTSRCFCEWTNTVRVSCTSHKVNPYWELHCKLTIKLVTGHDVFGQSTDEVLERLSIGDKNGVLNELFMDFSLELVSLVVNSILQKKKRKWFFCFFYCEHSSMVKSKDCSPVLGFCFTKCRWCLLLRNLLTALVMILILSYSTVVKTFQSIYLDHWISVTHYNQWLILISQFAHIVVSSVV